ncbi:MAG: cation:proton antiporter [Armatimonadetes bacterium]|nr:cation:proton antiporter [Armatimonadota bacterium]
MNQWLTAALWMGLALAASVVSIRLAISVALVEILFGVIGGNFLGLRVTPWVDFLAGFGSVLLTFLAGAEIEPETLRRHWRPVLSIGFISFLFPFLGAMAFAYYVLHWSLDAAKIAGIALSTTSVAVVYAVMLETGLNKEDVGRFILAACFVTDLGTVLALGIAFAHYDVWLAVFVLVTVGILVAAPRLAHRFFTTFSGHVSEPETKLIFLLLFFLGGLAVKANSEAVLTAYLLGLVVASVLAQHQRMVVHMRATVFTLLTPFYFLKAGSYISLRALWAGLGLIALFFLVKVAVKITGVYPLTRSFGQSSRTAWYTTMMMSTGLTFGTISALFGLTRGYINQTQYTVLVITVILTAIIPTLIGQAYFRPHIKMVAAEAEAAPVASEV